MDNKEIKRALLKHSNGASKEERDELANILINQLINLSFLDVEDKYNIDVESYQEYMYNKILEKNDEENKEYLFYCHEIEQENKSVGIFVGNEEYIQTPMDAGEYLAEEYLKNIQRSENAERRLIKERVSKVIQNHVEVFLDYEYDLEEIQLVQNS